MSMQHVQEEDKENNSAPVKLLTAQTFWSKERVPLTSYPKTAFTK